MARKMSELEVHQVKVLICEGFSQIDTARIIGISATHVNRICKGDVHRDVPWPNAAVGEKLMVMRTVRSKTDEVQAQLTSGLIEPPSQRETIDAPQVIQASEQEAIAQAQKEAENREEMRKEIFRRSALVEKEMDDEFLEAMTPADDRPREAKGPPLPTVWDVAFLSWEEVLERAQSNSIVQVLIGIEGTNDIKDITMQRAVGIVFHSLNEKEWDAEQTPKMVAAVAEQLEQSQPVAK